MYLSLLGTNGFVCLFITADSRCRQNLKYENFTSSFGRLRQKFAPKSVPHVQYDYFSSFNQSNQLICGVVVAARFLNSLMFSCYLQTAHTNLISELFIHILQAERFEIVEKKNCRNS